MEQTARRENRATEARRRSFGYQGAKPLRRAQIAEDGKTEQDLYDKFKCWCTKVINAKATCAASAGPPSTEVAQCCADHLTPAECFDSCVTLCQGYRSPVHMTGPVSIYELESVTLSHTFERQACSGADHALAARGSDGSPLAAARQGTAW